MKAVEMIARPPLTSIRERIELFAKEGLEDVQTVLVVTYPITRLYNFGQAMTVCYRLPRMI